MPVIIRHATRPLYMDLVPENRKENVISNLVKDIEDHEFHLTTGNLSTKYIFEALSKFDKIETAYKLLTQRVIQVGVLCLIKVLQLSGKDGKKLRVLE